MGKLVVAEFITLDSVIAGKRLFASGRMPPP